MGYLPRTASSPEWSWPKREDSWDINNSVEG